MSDLAGNACWQDRKWNSLHDVWRAFGDFGKEQTGARYLFRGEQKFFPSRLPGLSRQSDLSCQKSDAVKAEMTMLAEWWQSSAFDARTYLPQLPRRLTVHQHYEQVMALAQHRRAKTRLLDWTDRFEFAVMVACADDKLDTVPGFLFCFDQIAFEEGLGSQWEDLGVPIGANGQRDWTPEMWKPKSQLFVTKWHYPHHFPEIFHQGGLFTVCSSPLEAHDEHIRRFTTGQAEVVCEPMVRFTISAKLKRPLRTALQEVGIEPAAYGYRLG